MYGIGRAEAARFERHSRCFERHSKVLRATQQKGARAVSVTRLKFPHFHPYGSGARPDLSFTPRRDVPSTRVRPAIKKARAHGYVSYRDLSKRQV
jgi:hypothetical protein